MRSIQEPFCSILNIHNSYVSIFSHRPLTQSVFPNHLTLGLYTPYTTSDHSVLTFKLNVPLVRYFVF